MTCGVYSITNTVTNKVYIGSSSRLENRMQEHRRMLKNHSHTNRKLNGSVGKHGFDAFVLTIELVCDEDNKYLYEQLLIDFYDSANNGYNLNPKAERGFSKEIEPLSDNFFNSRTIENGNGCKIFTGAVGGNGMAKVKRAGKFVSFQRLAYEFYVGEIPDNHFIYRTCKDRRCLNPSHLKSGTRSDIVKNTFKTGRVHARGNVKLAEENVKEIKMSNKPMLQLAKQFNVSDSTIRKIKRGETWQHVDPVHKE